MYRYTTWAFLHLLPVTRTHELLRPPSTPVYISNWAILQAPKQLDLETSIVDIQVLLTYLSTAMKHHSASIHYSIRATTSASYEIE
ncbi:hypothetical protein FN846DRAFT_968891 [Sphaerosporella brunnea]|uniref:Uncharacterized protein n=1 Tax=Sphaerosporella brunnea TaxID=1250544 RepID=A0A5J5EK66_9PEZI|nr:hypothetical protein FN846DRAFT_968891 [Sphaerosporella brunnea]